ncbi:MAG: CocE/NonD family hydrolase [Solirubrobacterales bacterium]|nr:CocE/NonD family hydrolase [Solirubrobacterales bacterium]
MTLVVWLGVVGSASAWTPEGTSYGVGEQKNVSITAADGTKLFANVYYPTDPQTGQEADGKFPTILNQTPYGKDDGAAGATLGAGADDYLIQRGYIEVVADVRGTGTSEGEWGLFDPVQGTDGAGWVKYAAALPHASGKVGLIGPSYMGIDQFETAADSGGPGDNPVKAMFPVVPANEVYRDTAFAGGFPDIEFDAIYLSLTGGLNTTLPWAEGASDMTTAETQHIRDLSDFDLKLLSNVETGGDQAYDGDYWQQRSPNSYISQIVKDGIPAFVVGGWYDLFQRGEPLDYANFQNVYDGRPQGAAMTPDQPVTPRYQLLVGPWYHTTTGSGLSWHGLDMDGIQLAWFDHWLKGADTGITDTTTPMHLEDLATGAYHDVSRYPLDQATPTAYYLHDNGGLSASKPSASEGKDTLAFTGASVPCSSSLDQWAAGLVQATLGADACTKASNLSQVGPGTHTYTTAPFTSPTTLAGPIGASLYASTSTKDAEWDVQLSDVAPNGQATSLTSGLLEGAQRATDPSQSWTAPDGNPLLPYHPYTKGSYSLIKPGQQTRFDVEVFPTYDTLQPGHRLRVTISTSDFPHVIPTATQLPNLLGGLYTLDHNASGPSSVELPLIK